MSAAIDPSQLRSVRVAPNGADGGSWLREAMDAVGVAWIGLDAEQRIHFANAAAERLLARACGFRRKPGANGALDCLYPVRPRAARALQLCLVRAQADAPGATPYGDGWLIASARPAAVGGGWHLRIVDGRGDLPAPAQIADGFDLTPAEARLVSRLGVGDALADAARELGLSRNTVRNRLATVFEKQGLHSQSALRARLARFAALLGSGGGNGPGAPDPNRNPVLPEATR